jgi:hypothetical protein
MPHRTVRAILPIAGLSLLVAASVADAQVTIDMTTQLQTNCTVVTDASGLRLAPNGNNLQATGVTLTGEGCGGGTAGAGSDFAAAVNAPANATAGTPFDVSWSAAADATRCTYGGTAGASGWPVGTTACQDGACTGSHTASVVVPAAGNYSFSMTCTNASGYAQAGTTATGGSGGAPQPPNFALTAPLTATTGSSFNVSWSVTDATTCTGSASLNGSSASLPGWTTATTATSPRSVTPTVAGVYTLTLACSNSGGSVTSQPAVVTVTQGGGGDSCPAGRQTVADVCYHYNLGGNCSNGTDVTKFENIWGRMAPADTPVTFPGKNKYAIFKNLQKTQYIAAKFSVPQTGLPTDLWGKIRHDETMPGSNLSASISQWCGDFTPADTRCAITNVGTGQGMLSWKLPGYPAPALCPLAPGQTYYVNIKITDPTAPGNPDDCSGSTCRVSTVNNFTDP